MNSQEKDSKKLNKDVPTTKQQETQEQKPRVGILYFNNRSNFILLDTNTINMRTRNITLIIMVVILCLIGAGAYIYLNSTPEYKNITMNGVEMEVPSSNITVLNQTRLYSIYNDSDNAVQIIVFDSEGSTMGDISEMTSFAAIREANQVGAQITQKDNISYNYSSSLKQYTYLCNFTHKNVFVTTKDEKVMQQIVKTMKLSDTTNSSDTQTSESKTS